MGLLRHYGSSINHIAGSGGDHDGITAFFLLVLDPFEMQVRHLELRAEEEVPREDLVKYFIDNTLTPAHVRKRISNLRLGS